MAFDLLTSKSIWFETRLKLNLFGLELYWFPIKYGNLGFLKFLNTPSYAAVESNVAKYAYVPFGYSGVIQNLPLFSSSTESSLDTL